MLRLKKTCEESITTISALEHYLEKEGFNFDTISIGKHHSQGYDDIMIQAYGEGDFRFSYVERGNISLLKSFASEALLVAYTLAYVQKHTWLKAHILAMSHARNKIEAIESILNQRKIVFERNDISDYDAQGSMFRIYVFGKDIDKVQGLKRMYAED